MTRLRLLILPALLGLASAACSSHPATRAPANDAGGATMNPPATGGADVLAVTTTGSEESFTFSVTLQTGDTGCGHYADWWEVLDSRGDLVYRRILGHSHVDEQPFTRSGGPVTIPRDAVLTIRAHMNDRGYGGVAFRGSIAAGFQATPVDNQFASAVANAAPQPTGCAF